MKIGIHLQRLFDHINSEHWVCTGYSLDLAPYATSSFGRRKPLPVEAQVPENHVVKASRKWRISPQGRCIFFTPIGYKAMRPKIEKMLAGCNPAPKRWNGRTITMETVDEVFFESFELLHTSEPRPLACSYPFNN